ncbi:hypothetical protein MAH3_14380 [Sessilibacter sp. MAH3]
MPYYEGLAFDKFWSIPVGVLPVGLVALLTFVVSARTGFGYIMIFGKRYNKVINNAPTAVKLCKL